MLTANSPSTRDAEFDHNIHSRDAIGRNAVDWGFLNPVFTNQKMRFSDVDGRVEINGYFLELEAKPNERPLSRGQQIAYERRSWDDRTSVLIMWHSDGCPIAYQFDFQTRQTTCTRERFIAVVRAWVRWAEAQERAPKLDRRHIFSWRELRGGRRLPRLRESIAGCSCGGAA